VWSSWGARLHVRCYQIRKRCCRQYQLEFHCVIHETASLHLPRLQQFNICLLRQGCSASGSNLAESHSSLRRVRNSLCVLSCAAQIREHDAWWF
jgi:hypothetical protein